MSMMPYGERERERERETNAIITAWDAALTKQMIVGCSYLPVAQEFTRMRRVHDIPDEIWRWILEIGVSSSTLGYKDLCCLSISCRCFRRLCAENNPWSHLISLDFGECNFNSSSSGKVSCSTKSAYISRFNRERTHKLRAHRRAVFRLESQIFDHCKKIQDIEVRSGEEIEKLKAAVLELSNLEKVRQASVAMNVWQPEVVRNRQKHLVEQCVVPVDSRINMLRIDIKLCKEMLRGMDKVYKDEKTNLDRAKHNLERMMYNPLHDIKLSVGEIEESNTKCEKIKKRKRGILLSFS